MSADPLERSTRDGVNSREVDRGCAICAIDHENRGERCAFEEHARRSIDADGGDHAA